MSRRISCPLESRGFLFALRILDGIAARFTVLEVRRCVIGSIVTDPGGENVETARKALGSRLGTVHEIPAELFQQEKPDLALVTIEAKLAPPVIYAALDADCHVMVEKPSGTPTLRAHHFRLILDWNQT